MRWRERRGMMVAVVEAIMKQKDSRGHVPTLIAARPRVLVFTDVRTWRIDYARHYKSTSVAYAQTSSLSAGASSASSDGAYRDRFLALLRNRYHHAVAARRWRGSLAMLRVLVAGRPLSRATVRVGRLRDRSCTV